MAAPRKILICEDEDAIREFEVINLQRSGYEVVDVSCGEDAIRVFDEQGDSFSVAILDIMMPGIDGFAVCKHIREKNNTLGIIMLSAKSQEMDKVNGLMLGADDYITKPFSPSELVARVDAVYRRVSMSSAKQEPETELRSGPFQLNIRSRSLTRDGQKIDLTQVEFQLMEHFMRNPNVDGFEYKEADVPMAERPEIDRWILSVLNTLIKEVDTCYNEYEPTKAGRLISDFVNDNLSNWYVRLNRKRFWGGEFTQDKLSAYQTLYTCLETVAKLMAPISPFYADRLYTDLITATGRDNVVSVHLAEFPKYQEEMINKELETRMQMAQDVTSMVLALRRKVNIKVRQPLQCIMVPVLDEEQKAHIEAVKSLIMNEVNVKEIKFVDGAAGVLVKKVKCDFKKLGPKFGKQMKAVAAAVAEMSQEAISELEKNGKYTLNLNGEEAVIEVSDVEIISEDIPGWLVANEGKLTVALEVTVTEELRREGIARELVNRIQNIRKSSGFEITDKIKITISKNTQTDDAVNEYNTYICNQVLGTSLELVDEVKDGTELSFDDFSLFVNVIKD